MATNAAIDRGWIAAPTDGRFAGDLRFGFPNATPAFRVLVMLPYPLLSVYPQELIFRSLLVHRYRLLFPGPWAMVLVSALLFGAVHAFFALRPAFSVAASTLGGCCSPAPTNAVARRSPRRSNTPCTAI